MTMSVTVIAKRIAATAEIRHRVTASVTAPTKIVAVQVAAGRGPQGKEGPPGNEGPPGGEPDLPSLSLIFENQLI